jgi:signal recognition particle GTPase
VLPTIAAGSEDDLDLASILADLGLDEDFLNSKIEDETETAASESVIEGETEEEKAEKARLRKEETARKRADITGRHAKWEADLEERMTRNRKALRHSLVTSRKAATAELKDSKEIHKEIEDLVEEAEKYLKGTEKYLANLRKESRSPEEKKTIWDRVADKVDKKFEERLSQTESVVNGWYLRVLENELAEVSMFVTT